MTETPPADSEQAFLDRAVVIALGSNVPGAYGSSCDLLNAALKALDDHGLHVVRASSWWRSKAWPEGSGPDFLNGVALAQTVRDPRASLSLLLDIEHAFGRRRQDANSPRTLDLDLIAHGRVVLNGDDLVLPHPRAARRLFVMGPLAEIAPGWRHPLTAATASDLARSADIATDAVIANPADVI